MNEPNQTAVARVSGELELDRTGSIKHLLAHVGLVGDVMEKLMVKGQHFDAIPGCGDKPVLLQSGAEKLQFAFRLVPVFHEQVVDFPGNHREYRFTCDIQTAGGSTLVVGYPGTATTLEGKWRFRTGPKRLTGKPVPVDYWNLRGSDPKKAQELIGGKGFGVSKDENGQWVIGEMGEKVEHDNPADNWNTCRKMAAKRAYVGAIIKATGCSDIFTQDIEELDREADALGAPPPSRSTQPPSPPPTTPKPTPTVNHAPATAHEATEKTKEWFIEQLADYGDLAVEYFRKAGIILSTEDLNDLPLDHVPTSTAALRELLKKIEAFRDGEAIPSDPAPEGEEWRAFPMPWGKQAGKALGDVEKNYLYGLWANFAVETEYNGKPKKPETIAKDRKFREMLDAAGTHYEFKQTLGAP